MAKDKSKKQDKTAVKTEGTAGPLSKGGKKAAAPRVKAVVRTAGKRAADLASNPAVAEVVAATLVAAAAAIKNPKKARAMAASVGEELESASANVAGKGGAFWQMALDIARRSIEAMGADEARPKPKGGKRSRKNSFDENR